MRAAKESLEVWKSVDRIELKYTLSGGATLFDLKEELESLGFGRIFINIDDLKSGTITAVRVKVSSSGTGYVPARTIES